MKTNNKTKMPKLYKFGQKPVILDRDLANYLSVETKRIRETIKRNRNTFPIGSVLYSTSKISDISPRKEVREQSPSDLSATFFDFSATFCDPEKRIEKQSTNIIFALDKEGILFLSSKRVGAVLSLSLSALASFMDSSEEKRDKLLFPSSVSAKDITKSIHHIRNEFVILDEDLAIYYHSTVKRVNEQVKRNPLKFPKGFVFQLSQEEHFAILKSQNATSRWGGKRKLPYAFTEAGVYMLMTVLDSEIAAKQSVALILAFKEMKDRLYRNQYPLISVHEFDELKTKVWENDQTLTLLNKEVEDIKDRLDDPNAIKYFIIHNGERALADEIFQKIYSRAKASIFIIDDYIGLRTLEHLRFCPHGIRITFISDNAAQPKLTQSQVNDFQRDRPDLKLTFLRSKRLVHDRLIAIDMEDDFVLYHCGGSSKDAGEKITFIQELPMPERYKEVIEKLLDNEPLQMD